MSGSASLKKPPGSPSMVTLTRVPPSMRSKVTEDWNGNGPDSLFAANFRFGSNSVISDSLSMRRPRSLPTERVVVPTPMGPAEVFLASSEADDHFGLFSWLLSTAKTSSTGRLIVALISAFAITDPLQTNASGLIDLGLSPSPAGHLLMTCPPQVRPTIG